MRKFWDVLRTIGKITAVLIVIIAAILVAAVAYYYFGDKAASPQGLISRYSRPIREKLASKMIRDNSAQLRRMYRDDFAQAKNLDSLCRKVTLARLKLGEKDSISLYGASLIRQNFEKMELDSLCASAKNSFQVNDLKVKTAEEVLIARLRKMPPDTFLAHSCWLNEKGIYSGSKVGPVFDSLLAQSLLARISSWTGDSICKYFACVRDKDSPFWQILSDTLIALISKERNAGRLHPYLDARCPRINETAENRLLEIYLERPAALGGNEMHAVAKAIKRNLADFVDPAGRQNCLQSLLAKTENLDTLIDYLAILDFGCGPYLQIEDRIIKAVATGPYSLESMVDCHKYFRTGSAPKAELENMIRARLKSEVFDYQRLISLYQNYGQNDQAIGVILLEQGKKSLSSSGYLRALAKLRQSSVSDRDAAQQLDSNLTAYLGDFSKEGLAACSSLAAKDQYLAGKIVERQAAIAAAEKKKIPSGRIVKRPAGK